MTYYINPIWFYLIGVCESLNTLSTLVGGIVGFCTIALIIFAIGAKVAEEDDICNFLTKRIKPCIIITVVFIFLACAIPSKETCEEMMIASVVTHENVQQAKDDVKSIVDYVFDRIENDSESE